MPRLCYPQEFRIITQELYMKDLELNDHLISRWFRAVCSHQTTGDS
jgi:hypothetical protein